MPNELITLPDVDFTPGTFQGSIFTPQQVDMSLLARSLDKIEEREEKLATQDLAMNEAFSKLRDFLPDNKETNQYITDNLNRIKDERKALLDVGDINGAYLYSKREPGRFLSSPEFNARRKEHASRKEWLEQIDRSNVDNYIKEYFKDTYQDRNNFTRDKDGNITGTAGWEAPLPEQGQSATAIIQTAVKSTADQRIDIGSSWTGEDGTGGSSASSREWLTADRISQTAKSIVNNNPRVKQAFVDQFNAGIHQINKLTKVLYKTTDPTRRAELENQIAGYESTYYKNGAPMESAQDYIDNLFSASNDEIKNAAYDYKHSKSGSNRYAKGLTNPSNPDYFNQFAGADFDANVPGGNKSVVTSGTTMSVPEKGRIRPTGKQSSGGARPTNNNYIAPSNDWS